MRTSRAILRCSGQDRTATRTLQICWLRPEPQGKTSQRTRVRLHWALVPQNPSGTDGPGEPLPRCVQNRLAPYFPFPSVNLDNIRIHFGFPTLDKLTGAIGDFVGIQGLKNALAITIGDDIYFQEEGYYNPDTPGGIGLIGHEDERLNGIFGGDGTVFATDRDPSPDNS